MLRSIMLMFVLMFVSNAAFAQAAAPNPCANIPEATRFKSAAEIQTILDSCRETEAPGGLSVPKVTPEQASQWSDAAKGFAQAIGIAAKELGIAVNEFLTSPAGFLLAAILVFNYAGGVVIGFPFSIFSTFVLLWLYNRATTHEIKYEMVPIFWGAFHYRRKTGIVRHALGDSGGLFMILACVIAILMNLIVWVNLT